MSTRRPVKKVEELTEDMKNDLYLGFNLMKNNREKLSKLKLRSLLFNFAMYKSSPSDINEFINENYPKQEEFSYEELLNLVLIKFSTIKEREVEDTWNLFANNKQTHSNKNDLQKALNEAGIECNEKELNEMICYINNSDENKDSEIFSKEAFKQFLYS